MGCSSSSADKAGDPQTKSKDDVKTFLLKVPLFRRLPEDCVQALSQKIEDAKFLPGQTIFKCGDIGDSLFVIRSGKCKVMKDSKEIATLKGGDFFGEVSLLRSEEPRTATIEAVDEVCAYKITRELFDKLQLRSKVDFPKRGAVAGAQQGKVETKPPCEKNQQEKDFIAKALTSNENIVTMAGGQLEDAKIDSITKLMWKESVAAGSPVIKQGDLSADYFYVITEGSFEVVKQSDGDGKSEEEPETVGLLSPGQGFGELALMYFAPRAATVTAKTASTVMVIDRGNFQKMLVASSQETSKKYVQYLDKVEILASSLKDKEKIQLAQALQEMRFSQDEFIFEQGETGLLFYILIQGSVVVIKDGKTVNTLVADDKSAHIFGEGALLTSEPRAASIKVTSSSAITLTMDKDSFDMLLGPLAELKKRGKSGTAVVTKKVQQETTQKRFGNIKRKELRRMGLLGCGGFGAVEMVEHSKTGDTYALKALSKGYVVKSGMQESVMSEKNVQLLCDSPFVIKLYETYNGEQSLYLLLELALGGELYATYNKKLMWGQENCAKFYVAGTTYAFEHLHGKKIIFRDLKPENLLLTEKGHVKLTDMGLAKVVVGKTYTTCGTPDYFAPELIASKGHTHAVDWWTLGVLTFELLSGHPPFESATPMQIYQKVTKGINRVVFPKKCKGPVELFIKGLCNQNPSERLPMKKGLTKHIKEHAWYNGFDWKAMAELTLPAPYVPIVKNKKDGNNFSARKEDMPPQLPYKDDGTGWDADFATSD